MNAGRNHFGPGTYDCLLMNAVYLSELWAFNDLTRFKNEQPALWDAEREVQLNDELRHYKICLAALRDEGHPINHDLKYSMQERLYAKIYPLQKAQTLSELSAQHQVFEKRAAWVFRTYQRVGRNEKFKKIYRHILQDEITHLNDLEKVGQWATPLHDSDEMIWKDILPKRFGPKIFSSVSLWDWYYGRDDLQAT